MTKWRPHVVEQGEHVRKLAFRAGVPPEVVWGHPANRPLTERRPSMELLAPGDIIHLPVNRAEGLRIRSGEVNTYRATVPTVTFRCTAAARGAPISNQPFEVLGVHGAGVRITGTTGDSGEVAIEVPAHARELVLSFPTLKIQAPIRVGDLDPVDTRNGVIARLRNLGHGPAAGTVDDAALADAVRRFQVARGLSPTGRVDADLEVALSDAHGE